VTLVAASASADAGASTYVLERRVELNGFGASVSTRHPRPVADERRIQSVAGAIGDGRARPSSIGQYASKPASFEPQPSASASASVAASVLAPSCDKFGKSDSGIARLNAPMRRRGQSELRGVHANADVFRFPMTTPP
jgi:hypothetical protein